MISGQIEARPLAVLLYHLYQQQFTGEIAVQAEGGSSQIYLTEGAVVQVVLPENQQLLGQVLREAGVLSDAALRRALATPVPAGQRLGDVLLSLGLCDENRLLQGLRLQIGRRLGQLLQIQRGGYLAVAGPHQRGLQRGEPLLTPTPWAILFAARTLPLDRLKGLLGHRVRGIPRLLSEREFNAFGLDETGIWLVKALKVGGHGVDALVTASGVSAQALLATLYAFLVTEAITFDEPPVASPAPEPKPAPSAASRVTPPMPPKDVSQSGSHAVPASARSATAPSPSASTPRPVSLSERALLAVEIEQRSLFIAQEDPFAVLGVMEDADTTTIEDAFRTLTDRYAVERLVQMGLGGLVGHAGILVQRFHEAYEILRIPAKREQQRRKVAGRTPEQAEELSKARSRLHFMRGVVLLRNREFALSIPEFRTALRERPTDGELIGHLAWAEYGAGMRGREDCRQRILTGIERAPEAAPLYYFAGVIFKVEGDEDTALRCFAECCKRDPKTQAAASELRILLMRKVRSAMSKPASQSSVKLAPSSQSPFSGGRGKPSSQSQSQRPSAKSTPLKPASSKSLSQSNTGLQVLLTALKEATATTELLQLWQRVERELAAVPRESATTPPAAPSSESQRRGPLGFLKRILGPGKSSSSSTSIPPSKSSTSHPVLPRQGQAQSQSQSRGSSQSLPAFLSGMTPTPLTGAASTASQVMPRSDSSASSSSLPSPSGSQEVSSSMSARDLLERLQGPVTGNLKAVLTGASNAGRSTETVRLQEKSAATPPPLPRRPPGKG